jgi:hypothetical protein
VSYPCGRVVVIGADRLATLLQCRPWALSDTELVAALDLAHALRVEAEAVSGRLLREIDVRKTASAVGASSAAVWYRNRHLVSIRSAHRLVRLAKRIDAAPQVVGEGVAGGRVNLDQADVVTRAVARIPGEVGVDIREQAAAELVRLCGELDPDLLKLVGDRILMIVAPETADELDRKAMEHEEAQATRERYFTMTPDGVGVRLSGRLTAEGAAIVRAAIDPLTKPTSHDDRTPEQRRADALLDVCRLDNGDRVTPETVRRMACDCGIVPIVFAGPSQPLDLGRHHCLVNGPLRRALVARDRGCGFPGCDREPRWTPTTFGTGATAARPRRTTRCSCAPTTTPNSTKPTTGPCSSTPTAYPPSSHRHTSIPNRDPSGTGTTGGNEAGCYRNTPAAVAASTQGRTNEPKISPYMVSSG